MTLKRALVLGGLVKGDSGWSGVLGQRQKRQLALRCIAGVEKDEVVAGGNVGFREGVVQDQG